MPNTFKLSSKKIVLSASPRRDKKFVARITTLDRVVNVHFGGVRGDTGEWYNDFTSGGNRDAYLARHAKNGENWRVSGILTPGFWARWLLWEKKTYVQAKKYMEHEFHINIHMDSSFLRAIQRVRLNQ